MFKKLTPRADFIKNATDERVRGFLWDAMQLASSHDPEHEKAINDLTKKIKVLTDRVEELEQESILLEI